MSPTPTPYAGREQTFVKHSFLTQYLQRAAYKILQARSSVFNYVDAFAGPWRLSDDDEFSDASFHQAVRTLDAVRVDLGSRGLEGLEIRSFFCEKRPDAARRLEEYAQRHKELQIHVFAGPFENHIQDIEARCSNGFTFTFIDPTGWKIRSDPVFRTLARLRGEVLLNFMAEPINRHAGYVGVTDSIGDFLADPDWKNDFDAFPSAVSNERRIFHMLMRRMKTMLVARYFPYITIKRPTQDRTKMRLILGTNSEKEVEVFRDVQESVEKEEMKIRTNLLLGADQQRLLFPGDHLAAIQQEREGVGCAVHRNASQQMLAGILEHGAVVNFGNLSVAVMESIPIRKTHLKKLLVDLREEGVVHFELPVRARVPRDDTLISLA